MTSIFRNTLARRDYHAYLCGKSERLERVQTGAVAGGFPALLYAPQTGDFRRPGKPKRLPMSIDAATVRRIAHLARVAVAEDEVEHLRGEINSILSFVEQLSEVNVEGVEPMTSVMPMVMKKRRDEVTDGNNADAVLRNAPATENNYFLVPKVVE
jgi:aspartyl-tRNA(Asn)/glutamyl-tRNA(Gln) amidotransferase subunit C